MTTFRQFWSALLFIVLPLVLLGATARQVRDDAQRGGEEARFWSTAWRAQAQRIAEGEARNRRDLAPILANVRRERARQAYYARVGERYLRRRARLLRERKPYVPLSRGRSQW